MTDIVDNLQQDGSRIVRLRADSPHVDFEYRLTNPTGTERHFLWKLHAALAVEAGDVIDCPARQA